MWPESTQAKITLVAGIALALALALFSVLQSEYFNLVAIVLFTVPLLVLSAYDIQCIVTGQCEVYSWIKTMLFLVTVALAFYVAALRHRTANDSNDAHDSRGDNKTKRVHQSKGLKNDEDRGHRSKGEDGRSTGDYYGGRAHDDDDDDERRDRRGDYSQSGRSHDRRDDRRDDHRDDRRDNRMDERLEHGADASEAALKSNWSKQHPGVPFPADNHQGAWTPPKGVIQVGVGAPQRVRPQW